MTVCSGPPGPLSVGSPPLCDVSVHRLIEMLLSPCLVCKAVRDLGRHQSSAPRPSPVVPPPHPSSSVAVCPTSLESQSCLTPPSPMDSFVEQPIKKEKEVYMSLPGRSTAPRRVPGDCDVT